MSHQCGLARSGMFCSKCYEGLKGRAYYPGHFGAPSRRAKGGRRWMTLIKRRQAVSGSTGSSVPVASCKFSERFPAVVEFLSLRSWEDGTPRSTGTVTVLWEEGMFKAAVNDRDGGVSAFLSSKTFTNLWEALEKGLGGDTLEWRTKKEAPPARGGKRA